MTLPNVNFLYINLDFRPDRKQSIEAMCRTHGIAATRFKAKTPDESRQLKLGENLANGPHFATPPRKACYNSHYSLISQYTGSDILGVLEDDAVFCSDFSKRFNYALENLPSDWDMFFLNAHFHLFPKYHDKDFDRTEVPHIFKVYGLFCAHAYLINPKSIPKILSSLDMVANDSYAFDYSLILASKMINQYCFVPGMTTQLKSRSDIDTVGTGIRLETKKDTTATFLRECGPHTYTDTLEQFSLDYIYEYL